MSTDNLSQIDTNSATWRAINRHAEQRLEQLRAYLETPGIDPVETESYRGRIAELRVLLNLPNPSKIPLQPSSTEPI